VTTDLSRPLLFDGTVRVDLQKRELGVRPAAHARGLAKVLWDETVRTMAEESLWQPRSAAHTVGERRRLGPDLLRAARQRRIVAVPLLQRRPALQDAGVHGRAECTDRPGPHQRPDQRRVPRTAVGVTRDLGKPAPHRVAGAVGPVRGAFPG
jgi:hypothetical protein